jgi:hypothetical protein
MPASCKRSQMRQPPREWRPVLEGLRRCRAPFRVRTDQGTMGTTRAAMAVRAKSERELL